MPSRAGDLGSPHLLVARPLSPTAMLMLEKHCCSLSCYSSFSSFAFLRPNDHQSFSVSSYTTIHLHQTQTPLKCQKPVKPIIDQTTKPRKSPEELSPPGTSTPGDGGKGMVKMLPSLLPARPVFALTPFHPISSLALYPCSFSPQFLSHLPAAPAAVSSPFHLLCVPDRRTQTHLSACQAATPGVLADE